MQPGGRNPVGSFNGMVRPAAPFVHRQQFPPTPGIAPRPMSPVAATVSQMKDAALVPVGRGGPPVYRPQVLSAQRKTAAGARAIVGAPPVYRPQAASGQMKNAAGARIGGAPPVYRPQPSGGQMKIAVGPQPMGRRPPGLHAPARGVAFPAFVPKPSALPGGRPVVQPRAATAPPAAHRPLQQQAVTSGRGVVQRVVGHYAPGTLRRNYTVMKGLNLGQMKIVQQLHDDPHNSYSINDARAVATGVSTGSNPYEWEIKTTGSYAVTDHHVQSILDNFGDPTTDVVKKYDDLASRVGYDVDHGGTLSSSTRNDLNLFFDASKPLHFQFNDYLKTAWTENLDDYAGSKTKIPLYSVMRSEITKDFRAESVGTDSLNEILKGVSGRPAEIHHLLYKAKHPSLASNTGNLVLSQRSESEKRSGPGQHELMHMVSSGNQKDKFNVLLPEYEKEYRGYLSGKGYTL